MAVIINDFEIIPEKPESKSPAEAALSEGEMSSMINPTDVIDIVKHYSKRMERLCAH